MLCVGQRPDAISPNGMIQRKLEERKKKMTREAPANLFEKEGKS